jgi:hypothetical protein
MSETPKYRVVAIQRVDPRPNGTLRRNSYLVSVEVDGVVHDVRIRRESGMAKLPQELIGHPFGKEILALVSKTLLDSLKAHIRERNPELAERWDKMP